MSYGTANAKLLKNYGIKAPWQYTVEEILSKLGFKYNYLVNGEYVGGN